MHCDLIVLGVRRLLHLALHHLCVTSAVKHWLPGACKPRKAPSLLARGRHTVLPVSLHPVPCQRVTKPCPAPRRTQRNRTGTWVPSCPRVPVPSSPLLSAALVNVGSLDNSVPVNGSAGSGTRARLGFPQPSSCCMKTATRLKMKTHGVKNCFSF